MSLFNSTAFRITQQGLDILWQKQQIISQNIANKDTPDYKAKYLQFSGILREKMLQNGKTKPELHLTSSVVTDTYTADQADGNNVDDEQQQVELTRTQLQYSTLVDQMTAEFNMLKTAMKTS